MAGLVVLIAVPVLGALALVIVERARTLVVSVVRWRTLLDRRGQLDEVRPGGRGGGADRRVVGRNPMTAPGHVAASDCESVAARAWSHSP